MPPDAVGVPACPPGFHRYIAAVGVTRKLEFGEERSHQRRIFGIIGRRGKQHTDASCWLALLRQRSTRPGSRPTEKPKKFTSPHMRPWL